MPKAILGVVLAVVVFFVCTALVCGVAFFFGPEYDTKQDRATLDLRTLCDGIALYQQKIHHPPPSLAAPPK